MGKILRQDIKELMEDLVSVLTSAFGSEQYQMQSDEIGEDLTERREKALNQLVEEAESHDIRLVKTSRGFSFEPMLKGKVLKPEEFVHLDEEKRARIEEITAVLHEKLDFIIRQFHLWKREARKKIRELNREVAKSAVGILIEDLKKEYHDIPCVCEYIEALHTDVIIHFPLLPVWCLSNLMVKWRATALRLVSYVRYYVRLQLSLFINGWLSLVR